MDGVRAGVEDALERDHVHVVVDADGPNTGDQPVSDHQINRQGHKVATGEYGNSLPKCIERMEGKT